QFFLYLIKGHTVYDGRMIVLYIVHGGFAGILLSLLFNAVYRHGLLQDGISAVTLVGEYVQDHALAKADGFARNIVVLGPHHPGNIVYRFSSQIEIEDTLHDGCFAWHDLRLAVSALSIAKEPLVYKHGGTFLEL